MVYPITWEKVTCNDWYEEKEKIWLCLENKNAICEIDKNTKDVKILGSFPHNRLGERNLSLSVAKCGNYIVFCPFKANDIAMLNIYTSKLEFVDLLQTLEKNGHIDIEIEKFYRMIPYKNFVFFFGIKYPAIMRFDLMTKEIKLFDDWLAQIDKYQCKEAVLFTDGYAQKEDEIYLPIGRCNGVLKINLNTMKWGYIEIKPVVHGILGMTQKENYVWFTEYDVDAEKFFQWDLNNDKITQIEMPCRDAFYAPLYCNGSLFFFSNFGKKSYQYDLKSENWIDITSILPGLKEASDKKVQGSKISYFGNRSKKFYHWNFEKNIIYYDEIRIKENCFLKNSWEDYCNHYKQELERNIVEEGNLTIKDYMEIIGAV